MRLSIVNYGTSAKVEVPSFARKEDEAILAAVREIATSQNMGKGAAIVSEVLHTDLRNQNWRSYAKKGMDEACKTFYFPHFTPFLMHHEMGGGGLLGGGDPSLISVGTNVFAQYSKKMVETPVGVATGYVKVGTFIGENAKVGDTLAIDAIQSRRLMTLSIGARVADEDYRCSVCGLSRYDEECSHDLGKEYEGKLCYVDVRNPFFREYSAVYNPSDINAVIRRMDVEESANGKPAEEHCIDMLQVPSHLNIYEISGSKVYPSAAIPSKENTMGNKNTTTTPETTAPDANAELIKGYEETIKALELTIKQKDETITVLSLSLKEKIEALNAMIAASEETDPDEKNDPEPEPEPAPATTAPAESAPATTTEETTTETVPAPAAQEAAPNGDGVADPTPAAPASDVTTDSEVPGSQSQETTPDGSGSTETVPEVPEGTTENSGGSTDVPKADLRNLMLRGSLGNLTNKVSTKKIGSRTEVTATKKEGAPFQFRSLYEVIRDK